MKKLCMLLLAVCGVVALLIAPGPAAADYFVFPSPPDVNALGNISGAYRDFSIFSQNTLDVAGISNALKLPAAAHVEYTPANNTQPGWVNHGIDWYPDVNGPLIQHTYVINLPSPTGGQPPYIPGLHPINSLTGPDFDIGGIAGLLVLYNVDVTLPTTDPGFLDPNFLNKVTAIVAFVPGVSTAFVYEKDPVSAPEPGTVLLLGLGLAGLCVYRRRTRREQEVPVDDSPNRRATL
jgi:hypothetical protein